jgi:murein DD-endopeptidase MepM/ murein hydrolase activator NlpD
MSWNKDHPRYRRTQTLARRSKKSRSFFTSLGDRLDSWWRGEGQTEPETDRPQPHLHHLHQPPLPAEVLEELKIAVPKSKKIFRPHKVKPVPSPAPADLPENAAAPLPAPVEITVPVKLAHHYPPLPTRPARKPRPTPPPEPEPELTLAAQPPPAPPEPEPEPIPEPVPEPEPKLEPEPESAQEAAPPVLAPPPPARRHLRIGAVILALGLALVLGGYALFHTRAVPKAKVARIPVTSLPKIPPLAPGFFDLYAGELGSEIKSEVEITSGAGLGQALNSLHIGSRQQSETLINHLTKEGGLKVVRPGARLRAVWQDRGKTTLKLLEYYSASGAAPMVIRPRADGGFWLYDLAGPALTLSAAREGTVETSLWQAASEVGLDANVIMTLSDILASNVDFLTDIKKGDTFQVLFSREYQDGRPQGTPTIDMVKLVNRGRSYEFYRFVNNKDEVGFYNPEGRSSRKTFFLSPLQYKRISSGFTMNRLHPIYKTVRPHQGVDYAAPSGTPVSAVADGQVIFADWNGGYGRLITIRHSETYTTMYAHLSKFAPGLTKGSIVKQGDLIGHVGATGAATGPHLDFRMKKNGTFIDPVTELAKQQGQKLESGEDWQAFAKVVEQIRARMTAQLAAASQNN